MVVTGCLELDLKKISVLNFCDRKEFGIEKITRNFLDRNSEIFGTK